MWGMDTDDTTPWPSHVSDRDICGGAYIQLRDLVAIEVMKVALCKSGGNPGMLSADQARRAYESADLMLDARDG